MPARLSRRTLLTAAAVGGVEALLSACSSAATSQTVATATVNTTVGALTSGAATASPAPASIAAVPGSGSAKPTARSSATSTAAPTTVAAQPVHVRLYENDGHTYGVGMPVIVYLSKKITNAKLFAKATSVTVNGRAVAGAWYFQKSAIYPNYPLEAHYRMQEYWPAHAAIAVDLPIQGLSAGTGLAFDDSLTLKMNTGAANMTQVDGAAERLTVTSDGEIKFNFPVSLGKASTPTFTGIKVLMEKDKVERMVGTTPGDLYDLQVPWSVRLTNSGEFIHAASWNGGNIGQRSTSNGCTNLNVDAAQQYFNFAQIGDVASYTNTGGAVMPVWDGYGDWNLSWAEWQKGGLLATA